MSRHRPLPPGTQVADYAIEAVLGQGAMAVVYRAAHPDRALPVALKIISVATWGDDAQELLEHESRLAAAVAHRHILPVYEAGAHDGFPFVAMKLERCDLGAVLRREGRLTPERAVRYVGQVAAALDAAHAHGLVHRDIKPSNVLLGEDDEGRERALVADFGVARAAFSAEGLFAGDMVGTIGYVSPEQIRGDAVDQRTDVYALGCLLYECLTGRVPFRRGSSIATLWAHLHENPPPPSALLPELAMGVDAVLARALEKDARSRYGSAGALADAAAEAVNGRLRHRDSVGPAARDLPSGTVTFLFTDVESSTKLLYTLGEEAYADALAEHRDLVRVACAAGGGVEVDTQGDAFFFAFPTAGGALAASRDFTARLAATDIAVRVGIHTGTPHVTGEGYVGADVHRAARIGAAGHGGQVLVSEQTAALLEDTLVSLGSHRLKDFDGPVRIYQALDGSFPPLKTIANTNLPSPASSFIGRESELVGAGELLQQTRLLTIVGPGGQGKTRFALELARRVREERFSDYQDGVFACFLAPLRDPALVLPTIAQTLSVAEQAEQSALETLSAQLAGKKLFLLLDNLEHVLSCAPELSRLLQACPDLTLLVTSRELLRLQGEIAYALPSLPDADGVALFCERAGIEPTATIDAICARLEGLPLAIELAAARLRLLSPEQLLDRLGSRLDLLKGGRDTDPRQQTLRATIEWSYELLAPDEQTLFARLSVFADGCTLEAVEEVAEADLDTIESLLDKSLLRRLDTETGPRFWMLETIREYAAERLEASEEASVTSRRHAEFVLGLAAVFASTARRATEDHRRFLAEQNNFRWVRAWAARVADSELELDLIGSSWPFWWYRGYSSEGAGWVESALKAASPERTPRRMRALAAGAMFAFRSGALDAVEAYAEESLQIARELDDRSGMSWPLVFLGIAANEAGEFASAKQRYEEATAIASEVGDQMVVGVALNNLGVVAISEGDAASAVAYTERALELAEQLDAPDEVGVYTINLAAALLQAGRPHDAADVVRRGLALARATQNTAAAEPGLILVAAVAVERGSARPGALLLGAASRLRPGEYVELSERGIHARATDAVAAALADEEYDAAFAEGATMSLDEAVAYALDLIDAD